MKIFLVLLFSVICSISTCFAHFKTIENWKIKTQGQWNKVLTFETEDPEIARFTSVTFNVMPMNATIANKFHKEKNINWETGIQTDSQIGFKVTAPTPELKSELIEKINSFNKNFKQEEKTKLEKKHPLFAAYITTSSLIKKTDTANPNDVAFMVNTRTLSKAKNFKKILALFEAEKTIIDSAIFRGLTQIQNKWEEQAKTE